MAETQHTNACTDLVPATIDAVAVFTGGLDDILAGIRARATESAHDVTTATGRKAIASVAYRVAQSKTFLDAAGKSLVDEAKKKTAAIDAERKRARDYLDALKDEVRAPLTAWENERAKAELAISKVVETGTTPELATWDTARIEAALASMEAGVGVDAIPQDMQAKYAAAVQTSRQQLLAALSAAKEREAQAAEIARLKAEAEAKARAEREESLRREGEERARAAAERAIADAAARAERQRLSAIEDERRRVEAERDAAEQKANAERAAAEARQRNEAHRAAVNAGAVSALVAFGISSGAAEMAVQAVSAGAVPGMAMVY